MVQDVFSGKIQVLSLLFGICEAGGPCQASRRQPKLDTCLLCTEMAIPHALCLYLNSKHELLLPSYEEHWLLIRAAFWSLDYSDRSARKRAWGIGPQPFSFLSLARKRETEHQLHPLLVLVLLEEAVSTTCPISSYPPGEGSTDGFPWTLAQALDFPVPSLCSLSHGICAGGLISPRFWYQVYLFIYFLSPEGKKVARFFFCVCVCWHNFFFPCQDRNVLFPQDKLNS